MDTVTTYVLLVVVMVVGPLAFLLALKLLLTVVVFAEWLIELFQARSKTRT